MASQFLGIIDAFDFAYGVNPSATAGLQVISGSNAAGTYTVTCAPANLASADGIPITLSTLTPITIGADSNIETVTPTAVSKNGLNQILITAVFANAHSTGDVVRSGDGGLQEAALFALSQGSGAVAISPQWFQAVGVAVTPKAALDAKLLTYISPSINVTILDYSGATGTATTATALSYNAAAASGYAPVNTRATGHIIY